MDKGSAKWDEVAVEDAQASSRLQRRRQAPKRMRDEWDEEYDRGHVRKVKLTLVV